MEAEKLRIARDKLTRVFRYLEALNQHRNPAKRQIREQLWSLPLRELPVHSSIQRGAGKPGSAKTKNGNSQNSEDGGVSYVLKVQRPRLTRAPEPPLEIADWLEDGWDDPSNTVVVEENLEESENRTEPRIVKFTDDPARIASLEHWKLLREEWASTEKPARAAMKIFETFYALYGRIDREAERVELILGDGILSWHRTEGSIHHPILLQRLQLQFDASVPEFTLSEADYPVELYSALFQSMNDVDGRAIGRCREELDEGGFHPLVNGSTSGFLKRLVVLLSPHGEFLEDHAPKTEASDPCIGRDPVLFLRARTLGFAAAIEGILTDLRTREDLPWSLLNIVGEESPIPDAADSNSSANGSAHSDAEVLLSKPANPEQIRIAQQLEEHGGVLVQGPPGTGKTHTIGNLVGHLLAHGKSVLVTSHTTKALRMVRHHIVSELRPLCVSVLESDLDSRKQLESAVGSIAERLSRADAGSLELEAKKLESERLDLLKKLDEIRNQLTEARADEYREIAITGKSWVPADAARQVVQEKETHGWIPGPVAAVAPLPLSPGELADLYRTSVSLSREDEQELSGHLPDLHDLPRAEDFEASVSERNRLGMEDLDLRSDLWDSNAAQDSPEEIEELAAALARAVEPLSGKDKWKLAAVYAGKYGDVHRQPWDQLVSFVRLVHREAANAQESFVKYGPEASDNSAIKERERIAGEILAHLEDGGKLGSLTLFTHKSWSQFLEQTKVNHARPRLPEHFQALRQFFRLKSLREDLGARWDRQVATLGTPYSSEMGDEVEKTMMQYCDSLEDCLSWQERTWVPLQLRLEDNGFRWDKFLAEQPAVVGSDGELARIHLAVKDELLPILDSRFKKLRLLQLQEEFRDLKSRLKLAARVAKASKVISQLLAAVGDEHSSRYREAYERLLELKSKQADLDLRKALLAKLETAAPAWAGAIRNRTGVHGRGEPPRDAASAWTWRQLNDELDRRSSVSLEALQVKSEKMREQLRRSTVELIDKRSWSSQARRTSSRQRQALVGWLDTIRRIGKGHGIRVSLLRAEAARKMTECRGAVPVWVMPLSRVVENFDPRTTRFDVVIIDEASQSDVMALVALYLGKTVLVVGDHEQVSPSAVGQDLGVIQNLIFQYLRGIPNSDLYDGQISIYDLARQSFGGTTCLVEHFRCVPEIIQFSNMVSYDGRIKPLRDASRVHLRPHTIAHRVSGSSRDGKVNRQEALTVASLVAAAIEQPEYKKNDAGQPLSFGVVSLVGDEQAIEIDNLVRAHVSPDRYEHHRVLCGNAAQFQGDERDVVFISLVDTAERGSLSLRDQELFKQRFNVAASRARDQMWIVHSLSPHNDLKTDDLRRQLIEHAEDPARLMRALEEKEKRTQSKFEREVMKRLAAAGYRVTPHWRIGTFRIDLVVEGGGKRLAIECDGDRYQSLEKLPEDMDRQSVLERMGWVFTRIRSSEFLRNPVRAMKPVFEKLEMLEIPPAGESSGVDISGLASHEVIDRVIRRAEELRRSWSKTNGASTRSSARAAAATTV
ncbi:MAG TPA: AAA domain-containing protein [Candidatus Dormibacteraeota bacterium]|jgi:very-short-patch-repair endonuclease|nr:AAA domain-containing protein [Candidatus Dormibacteraeota bacterium]